MKGLEVGTKLSPRGSQELTPWAARRLARNDDRAELQKGGGTVCRAVQALPQVRERQKGRQDALFVVIGEAHLPRGHLSQLHCCGFHVGSDFGLTGRAGSALGGLAPQLRAVVLDGEQEVLDTEHFPLKLLGYSDLAPANAGRRRLWFGHEDPLTSFSRATVVPKYRSG